MDASTHAWPISWQPVVNHARANGEEPDAVLHDPRLAAHRVLDRLAATAAGVHAGTPGARAAMAAQVAATMQTLPWLAPPDAANTRPGHESDCASCGSALDRTTLLHDDAVSGLAALARALSGDPAATAVHRLAAAARAAEHHLPALVTHSGLTEDLALLAAAPSDDLTGDAASATFGAPFWSTITASAALGAVSHCQDTLNRLSEEDLLDHPQPTGTPTNTVGIQRVDVPDPCGPDPRMTIHGSGFGASKPKVGVIVATWDTSVANSQLTYRNATILSWSDGTVVVQLPSTVVSGFAAFSDLQFIKDYNAWVTGRNSRLNVAMRANGCPGNWTVEVPLALAPPADPAAAYRAGAPVLTAILSPTSGPTRMFDNDKVYLHPGDSFRVGWVVYGADTLTLKAANDYDDAAQILSAAGYPATGAVLTPADGYLTLTAPRGRAAAVLQLEADNGCGTVFAELPIVVAGPPVAAATMTLFQSLVVTADVAVNTVGGTESLNPSTGNAVPLVAGKRTVVRIDWWGATEQLPAFEKSGALFTAEASIHVTGDALPFGGVDVPVCASTADTAPPPDPIVLYSGPGFDSPAAYQQYVSGGSVQSSFHAVLPAEICRGGTIFSTTRPQLTVVNATITVSAPNAALNWTLDAGLEVTFHPRRPVTLRYVPYGLTDPTNATQGPTDADCEAALKVAGSLLPVPDPPFYRLPGPALSAATGDLDDQETLVNGLEAQRTALQGPFSDATWRDEIWLVVGISNLGGVAIGEWTCAVSTDPLVCVHEIGHCYHQNHLDVCGNVPQSDPMSSWPDNGFSPVEGWDMWNHTDIEPGRLEVMAYRYCSGASWIHPERWRRIFLQAGPPA